MTAEVLRRAAEKMRERAEATVLVFVGSGEEVPWHTAASLENEWDPEDAVHIASWHPDVAMLAAKLLDVLAEHYDARPTDDTNIAGWAEVVDFARVFLGEDA